MDGVQSHQGYRATTRRQFTFYHSIPRNSWHSFNRPWIDERLSQSWSYPVVVLNMGPLDWPLLLDTYYWHLLSGKMKWWKWKKEKTSINSWSFFFKLSGFDSMGHDSWFTMRFWNFMTEFVVIMSLFMTRENDKNKWNYQWICDI